MPKVERRDNVYTLTFDDGETERVSAPGPTEAVARRTRQALPHTLFDESAFDRIVARRDAAVLARMARIAEASARPRYGDDEPRFVVR